MPRPSKGPHLWLRPESIEARTGKRVPPTWVIRDGAKSKRTGCAAGDVERANHALAKYIIEKAGKAPPPSGRDPDQILVAQVLTYYVAKKVDKQARPNEVKGRIKALTSFWQMKTLSEVTGDACREYAEFRGKEQAARRELEDLRAAIHFHHRNGKCTQLISVVLPEKSIPRERWLTRSEAAKLLWAAYSYREIQKGVPTDRRSRRHVARFILVALYTGTRAAAICSAAFEREDGKGFVDVDAGVYYRRAAGVRETKKRTPAIRIPDRLLAHLKRWRDMTPKPRYVVEFGGEPVKRVSKAFDQCVKAAKLGDDVTPHILRHTAVTWAMLNGADKTEAEGFFGLSSATRERVYQHHHPDHQKGVGDAVTKRPASARLPHNSSVTKREQTASEESQVVDIVRSLRQ